MDLYIFCVDLYYYGFLSFHVDFDLFISLYLGVNLLLIPTLEFSYPFPSSLPESIATTRDSDLFS